MANIVFSGLVVLGRLAGCATSASPLSVKATTEGVVRPPSAFSITFVLLPSITATQELVVPRSMPIALAISLVSIFWAAVRPCGTFCGKDLLCTILAFNRPRGLGGVLHFDLLGLGMGRLRDRDLEYPFCHRRLHGRRVDARRQL